MNVLLRPLPRSSVGTKYVMAVTGLLLIGFVLAHMAGNLLIFAGKDALNGYGHALEEKPTLLWTARVILLVIFVLHIVLGIRLTRDNIRARPVRYVYEDTVQANWASRHMLLTGLVLLAFVIYHLLHFTIGVTDPSHFKRNTAAVPMYKPTDPALQPEYDVAEMVVGGFRQPLVTLAYVVAMVFLALHLWHGASSWFQSLGLNGRGYDKVINWVGPVLALIVLIGNCSIPLAILAGYVPK
jgi:succinate dehydrogenase / fumarate reductase cytochrome b subunit